MSSKQSPWSFVPLLYFTQAVPVIVVQEVATVLYKDLGVPNAEIARWTSLIALPWALQMLLGPLVDLTATKRRWIFGGQITTGALLGLAALVLNLPNAFTLSLIALGFAAFASALTNIATDGFFILSLDKGQQAAFAGVQGTFFRIGRLFCLGGIIKVAGWLTSSGYSATRAWSFALLFGLAVYAAIGAVLRVTTPTPVLDEPRTGNADEVRKNLARTLAVVVTGVGGYFLLNALTRLGAHGLWMALDGSPSGPLKGWRLSDEGALIGLRFPAVVAEFVQAGLALGALVGGGLTSIRLVRNSEMAESFSSFFRQPGLAGVLCFLVFYRFAEAMVNKMSVLFLKDSVANGGMGVPDQLLSDIKGWAGMSGMIAGGLLGGWFLAKIGIRRAIWPMAILMHIPISLYLWAAVAHPPHSALFVVDFFDQFGYGFGFAGYMVILMRIAQQGRFATSHMAIGTGLGGLLISVAGATSGVLQSNFGYPAFFALALAAGIPGALSLFALRTLRAPEPV